MAAEDSKWRFCGKVFLSCLTLVLLLHPCASQTYVCTYFENQTIFSYQPQTELEVRVHVNNGAVSGTVLTKHLVNYVQFDSVLTSPATPNISISRTIEMLDATKSPPLLRLSTSLTLLSGSGSLTAVNFHDDLSAGLKGYWTSTFVPGFSTVGVFITGRTLVEYEPPASLAPTNTYDLQYDADASGSSEQGWDLQEGVTYFPSLLSFNYSTSTDSFGPMPLEVCIFTKYKYESNVFYEHGFTALTFFFAMLLGFLLVVLGVFLFLFICRRRQRSSISPTKMDEYHMKETSKKIVMDPKAALRKGFNTIKDHSIMAWNESIVLILSLKDKLHMFREIDNLDVLATMHVDTDLEQEQNDAAVQTSLLLVQGLRHNNDISKQTEDSVVSNFNAQLKDLDKKLDAEFKKELEVVYVDLSAKNKERLSELLQKHRAQKQQVVAATKELPDKERQGLLELIQQQQQMEENELTFSLSLEQNEETEKLRKEFAIRKRMGIKELQQSMMSDVVTKGQLHTEQAEWLMKEHKKQQEAVHRMYDEEISRQRMVLEEKLARRRALAQASETQEDDNKEGLNLTAAHIVGYLTKGRKNSVLTAEQSEEWIEEMKAKALDIKSSMDKANETQEKDLHKKLSQAKVSRLSELMKKHESEIQEYTKVSKAQQTEGPVDPVSYSEGLLKLKSQHRVELTNLENELDADHAEQLSALRQREATSAEDKLKEVERETVKRLEEEGMTEKVLAGLMKKYEEESSSLQKTQDKNRQYQQDKLKEELARRKREWMNRREKERQEQEDLREYEAEVVEKLVSSQVSMSEAERERIMKEHEKQMVLLENSLTLNKLRQQHALEERLNQKRAQQIHKLQSQQQSEVKKHRKTAENNGEEDDEETHREALELMKKHAQQRIAVMQGSELDIDSELEDIRIEMTKERALALKGQEERLGAMITALQMEKAREMTKIEEQQKAINNLKANLMDDLNERGILSTPECERILDIHREESEAMNQRLETQRSKQEQMLRQKLEQRMKQREQLIIARQEAEMKNLMQMPGSKFGAKVRRVMLIHKHVIEMEKFKNRMDREIAQSLADTRRQFEMLKLQKLQEQELSFVAGLVRVGCFQESELMDVCHMLFPNKTEQDIAQIMTQIMEGTKKSEDKDMGSESRIVERVYQTQYSDSALNRSGSIRSHDGSRKKRRMSKQSSRLSMTYPGPGTTPQSDFMLDAHRKGSLSMGLTDRRNSARGSLHGSYNPAYTPEYSDPQDRLGSVRYAEDDYDQDYDGGVDYVGMGASMREGQAVNTGRLPPLQEAEPASRKKKKKKGLLKRHKKQQEDDDDY